MKWQQVDLWKNDKQEVTCRVMFSEFKQLTVELYYVNNKFTSFHRRPQTLTEQAIATMNWLLSLPDEEFFDYFEGKEFKMIPASEYAQLERYIMGNK